MADASNRRGASRGWIITEVERPLRRLKTDYVDLYQYHRPGAQADIGTSKIPAPMWSRRSGLPSAAASSAFCVRRAVRRPARWR